MQVLQNAVDFFVQHAPDFKLKLDRIDFFSKFCRKLGQVDPRYFSLYVEKKHPLKKAKHENAFIKNRSPVRSKKEVAAYIAAREFAVVLSKQSRAVTAEDIFTINRLLRGLHDNPQAPLYCAVRCKIRAATPEEKILYQGAEPKDFDAGIAFLLNVINSPPAMHPALLSALVFRLLILLHPFDDGNGRTARLLSTYVMKKQGHDLMNPAYEEYYVWDREHLRFLYLTVDFYSPATTPKQIQGWVDFFLSSILSGYQELFMIKMACKIAGFKAKLLGRDTNIISVVSPVPPGTKLHIARAFTKRYGPVVGEWAYTDSEGNIIAWNVRFAGTAKNDFNKSYHFFQYYSNGTWQISNMRYEDALPLYGLHKLSGLQGKPVLVCEGEKSTDAAATLLEGTDMVTVSRAAAGGLGAVQQTDWEPLGKTGADVYIWRDNDDIGKQIEEEICTMLQPYGCNIKILSSDALADKPKKWDAADALAEGMTREECSEFFKAHMVPYMPTASGRSTAA